VREAEIEKSAVEPVWMHGTRMRDVAAGGGGRSLVEGAGCRLTDIDGQASIDGPPRETRLRRCGRSMTLANRRLAPAVEAPGEQVAARAPGTSRRPELDRGAGLRACHPTRLLGEALPR
jgi:hypothetical protein